MCPSEEPVNPAHSVTPMPESVPHRRRRRLTSLRRRQLRPRVAPTEGGPMIRRRDVVSRSVSGPTCGRRRLVPSRGVLCSCQPTGDGTWWARPPGDLHALLEFVPRGWTGSSSTTRATTQPSPTPRHWRPAPTASTCSSGACRRSSCSAWRVPRASSRRDPTAEAPGPTGPLRRRRRRPARPG